jgi:hypothetical protein
LKIEITLLENVEKHTRKEFRVFCPDVGVEPQAEAKMFWGKMESIQEDRCVCCPYFHRGEGQHWLSRVRQTQFPHGSLWLCLLASSHLNSSFMIAAVSARWLFYYLFTHLF